MAAVIKAETPTFGKMPESIHMAGAVPIGVIGGKPPHQVIASTRTGYRSDFVYGAPTPLSKGLAGFSNPTSFTADPISTEVEGKVVPTGQMSAPLAGDFVYERDPTPASKGLPGFSSQTTF